MTEQTPRVNATLLEQFTNRTVRIVGKVIQIRGDSATISSNGNIVVSVDRSSEMTVNNFVEIIGRVNNDLSIKTLKATDIGKEINMDAYEAVVDATHRYKELFYDPNQ